MKTRILIVIGIVIASALSLSYYAIYDSSTTVFLSCDPKHEQIGDRCVLLQPEQYCKDWCDTEELSDLGCDRLALDFVYRATNLFDEEIGDVYYRDWIGLPDGLSEEEFEKCVNIIKEKRLENNLENTADIVFVPSPKEFLKMDCEDLNDMYPDFPSEEIADAWITRMHECLNQQDQLPVLIELDKWRQVNCDSILNDGIPNFQNKISQQAYDIRWNQCMDIKNSKDMLRFDSSLYYEAFGTGSPLIYLDSHEPVLHEVNCERYAYWMTEHQKEKPDFSENYPRYPPWGNQIFPLVEYCLDVGSLIKTSLDVGVEWRFELNEN